MSHDTWLHRIARPLVRPLVATAVTPNHLTTARLLSGLAACAMLAVGAQPWLCAGAALFLVSMVLDRADGELARLGGRSSPSGHRYDLWADGICDTAILLALGIAQRDGRFGLAAVAMGAIAALSAAAIFAGVLSIDRRAGPGSVMFQATAGFDPDDAIAIAPLAACLGFADLVLACAAVATPAAAVLVARHLRRIHRSR